MTSFRFWKCRRFPNPLGCCCPPNLPPQFQNDVVSVQHKLLETLSWTKFLAALNFARSKLSDDIDVEIQELIHLRSVERQKPRPSTIAQIDRKPRAHCIDGLIDAAEKLHCAPSTLHLAVNYLDRYLSTKVVYVQEIEPEPEPDLRFVGLTCLMIASKYDGVTDKFKFDAYLGLCMSVVSRDDMIEMESRLLSRYLRYEVGPPTAWTFLERFVVVVDPTSSESYCMASYFAEVSLLSAEMLRFVPSLVAAASVFLARYVLEGSEKAWSADLRRRTMYRPSDLRDCVLALHEDCCCGGGGDLAAIAIKYNKNKYQCVALKTSGLPSSIPLFVFED